MPEKTHGQIAFEAYNEYRGGKNFLGEDTPPWDKLPAQICNAWEQAAAAISKALDGQVAGQR